MLKYSFDNLPEAMAHLANKVERIEALLEQQATNSNSKLEDSIFTIDEAASFLSLAKPTLYSKVSRNEIPFMKRGKRLYFSKSDLIKYIKGGQLSAESDLKEEVSRFLITKKGLNHGK